MPSDRTQEARERAERILACERVFIEPPTWQAAEDIRYLADRVSTLETALRWIVEMDDPEDILALERRRTITLSQIIEHCRAALAEGDNRP